MKNNVEIINRLRRLRIKPALQDLIRETRLHPSDFVYPLFIKEGLTEKQPVKSMPGVYQLGLCHLKDEIQSIQDHQIKAVILFGLPGEKDELGHSAIRKDGVVQQAIRKIKHLAPEVVIISDLCFCEYLSHGHCGIVEKQSVHNDKTLEILNLQALSHAEAGVDIIAPSGMMDGVIKSLRTTLDENNHQHISLLAYSAKYCSSLYDPFREAADGAPQFGDRRQYQMDPGNALEALREVSLDIEEGVDMVMVKPAMFYLDIIHTVKSNFPDIPLCAYQVSGEYALIKQGAKSGLIDEQKAMIESLLAIKRAGSDFIITYFAKDINALLLSR